MEGHGELSTLVPIGTCLDQHGESTFSQRIDQSTGKATTIWAMVRFTSIGGRE
jgi:hypothetical protein